MRDDVAFQAHRGSLRTACRLWLRGQLNLCGRKETRWGSWAISPASDAIQETEDRIKTSLKAVTNDVGYLTLRQGGSA